MALVKEDRVRETSTTTGTATYSLAGAETGFRTFSSGVGNGNTCGYVAVMGANWEVGVGTVSAGALARTNVIASSNGNSPVSWAAGVKQIGHSIPADLLPMLEGDNLWRGSQTLQNVGGDITLEVRADGDFTPRFTLRKAGASAHTNRVWQFRVNTAGGYAIHDQTAGADRIVIPTSGHVFPGTTATQDLGSTSFRWGDFFMAGFFRLEAAANREVDVHCIGDGAQPSLRLRRSGATSDNNHDWQFRINADGQLALRDQTVGADRILFALNGTIRPETDNAQALGNATFRWSQVFAGDGSINTSDAKEKKDIEDSDLGLEFLLKLRPVKFHWRHGRGDPQPSYGLIAQEIHQALEGRPFAGLDHAPDIDRWGLNYSHVFSIHIKATQELAARVQALEAALHDA